MELKLENVDKKSVLVGSVIGAGLMFAYNRFFKKDDEVVEEDSAGEDDSSENE